MKNYRFCPYCGHLSIKHIEYFDCPNCSKKVFLNSIPTAGVIVVNNGKYLLCVRGIEPYKGKLDVIGGFAKNGEHPEIAAAREFKEETGINVKITHLLGTYIHKYNYQDDNLNLLLFMYIGRPGRGKLNASDDVSELKWFRLDKVPNNLSTPEMKVIISDLQIWYKQNSN